MNKTVLPACEFAKIFWFESERLPREVAHRYHMYGIYHYSPELDVTKVKHALQTLVDTNYHLRSHFIYESDQLKQIVEENQIANILFYEAATVEEQQEYLRTEVVKPFNLKTGPLYRFVIVNNLYDGSYSILLNFHHIILDGTQFDALIKQIDNIYLAPTARKLSDHDELKNLESYLVSEKELLKTIQVKQGVENLQGYPLALNLPQSSNTKEITKSIYFKDALYQKLKSFSDKYQCSVFNLLRIAWSIVLGKYANQDEIVLSYPFNIRKKDYKNLKGCFVNTIYSVIDTKNHNLLSLIKTISQEIQKARQELTYLINPIQLRGSLDISQINCAISSVKTRLQGPSLNCLLATDEPIYPLTSSDAILYIDDDDQNLFLQFRIAPRILNQAILANIESHLITCLENLLKNPSCPLAEISILSKNEYDKLIYQHNKTTKDYSQQATIHQLFEEQVVATPDNTAIVYEDRSLSYYELNIKANRLANYLIETYAIKPNMLVNVCVDRSEHMLIALFAILKTGAGYVPIEPTFPDERIKYVLQDTEAKIILTHQSYTERLRALTNIDVLAIDDDIIDAKIALYPQENPVTDVVATDLAYVIYTSGTTGKPKGVMLNHTGIVNRLQWMQQEYQFTAEARVLQKTPYAFDVSVWELFLANWCGGSIIFAKPEGHKDSEYLHKLIVSENITTVHFVPTMLEIYLDYLAHKNKQFPSSLKFIFCSGEALTLSQVQKFERIKQSQINAKVSLHNLYGPTETSIEVSFYKCLSLQTKIPIGKPIQNIQMYVLDKKMQPVPEGVTGELYIGGVGVAIGYLNRPELTDKCFINHRFAENDKNLEMRLYKSGDLVCWLSDGNIEYIGRNDSQIKLRGQRIELDEIKSALLAHPQIDQAVVLARHRNLDLTSNDKYLIAYYISSCELATDELHQFLNQSLPEYMVPTAFVPLKQFPVSNSGKLDENSLPMPLIKKEDHAYVAPRTTLEKQLCQVWQGVFGLGQIGITDQFYQLGGDSLLCIRLVSELQKIGLDVSVRDILQYKSIENIIPILNSEKRIEATDYQPFSLFSKNNLQKATSIDVTKIEDAYPASHLQAGMLLESELQPGVFQDIFIYTIYKDFNYELFLSVWRQLIAKHGLLRTAFVMTENDGYVALQYKTIAVEEHITIDLQNTVAPLADVIRHKRFNYVKPGLFELIILNTHPGSSQFTLAFSMHHAIADGWSNNSLFLEFVAAYDSGKKVLNETMPSYAEFVQQEQLHIRQSDSKQFWTNYLLDYQDCNQNLLLNQDLSQTETASLKASFTLEKETSEKLASLAKQLDTSVDIIFLTAYQLLLSTFLNVEELVVGVVSQNRLEKAGSDVLYGLFINTLPFRMKIDKKNILALIQKNHLEKTKLQQHKLYPYGKIKADLNLRDNIYNCSFNYIHHRGGKFGQTNCFALTDHFAEINIPLLLNIVDAGNQIDVTMLGSANFVDPVTLHRLVHYFNYYLNQINAANGQLVSLTKEDWTYLINDINTTDRFYEQTSIPRVFEAQAAETPDAIALVSAEQQLSFHQLNAASNQLAQYLKRQYYEISKQTIVADTLIPICMERGIDIVISILAVLKTGAAYVPIDPALPPERIQYILKDTNAKILLTQSHLQTKLNSDNQISTIEIDHTTYQNECTDNLADGIPSTSLAYVIYTSGTTGNPKGVMIEHHSVINLLGCGTKLYDFKKHRKTSCFSSFVFDGSVFEIFPSLLQGGELHILSDDLRYSPELLATYINAKQLNYIYVPPAVLSVLPKIDYPSLEWILIAGEPCDPKVGLYWLSKLTLHNYYGPTEGTVCVTGKKVEKRNINEIGKPLQNSRIYILDKALNPVPQGVIGELYIGGAGLARGYLNRPDLTKERFIPNPFIDHTVFIKQYDRIYKTGDLVRMLADGNLEYIGRNDSQIQIRGFRVELSEIENALGKLTDIKQVCVQVRKIDEANELICFYVSKSSNVSSHHLRQQLKDLLPAYMIPSYWQALEEFPITINGKTDYKKLASLPLACDQTKITTSEDGLQRDILQAWQAVLGRNDIGLDENFFDVGGHSLKIVQLKIKLEKLLNITNIATLDLFKYPTIRCFSNYLSGNKQVDFAQVAAAKNAVDDNNEVAIIALSGAFSGAQSIAEYWHNIENGEESVTRLTVQECQALGVEASLYQHQNFVPVAGRIEGIEQFDYTFWGLTPKESALWDPQIRKFLEHCWAVLETAGYIKTRKQKNIGVFCGGSQSTYIRDHVLNNPIYAHDANVWELNSMHANNYLATRVSYMLGLRGPALNINTACSTSLVAIVEACEKLTAGKCDMAIAGAVSLVLPEQHGYIYEEGMIYSQDGHCRPFDQEATGTINGSGIGVLLLKKLKDAVQDGDNILAVIKGYATNNDGNRKVSFTAPSIQGQIECILAAQQQAGITADTISYVECHGTGTKLGDPIEVSAIVDAFNSNLPKDKKIDCTLGSVKAVIGHADCAAGVAGVIKVCKMLEHQVIPPQINFKSLNSEIKIDQQQFKIETNKKTWLTKNNNIRRAAISSFGIGGTNAHVILEEYIN